MLTLNDPCFFVCLCVTGLTFDTDLHTPRYPQGGHNVVLSLHLIALLFTRWKMDENKDTDSKESEEYEDDFEKDLEWLINEKEKNGASIIEVGVNWQPHLS